MPGLGDSAFIFILVLLLFGPKKLPVLARQLGKLMGDFRKASNEFRSQMEDELRVSEQADRQKEIAAIEAAAPIAPALEPEHPHIPPPEPSFLATPSEAAEAAEPHSAPLPIATSGELQIMPPSTGLPVANTTLAPLFNAIPAVLDPEASPTTSQFERRRPSMDDPLDRLRTAVTDRAELPGMSLMEHLEELRKRLIRSVFFLLGGFGIAYAFHQRLYGIIQLPLDKLKIPLNFTHPTDPLNLTLKTAFVGGAILASPFILYQLWLFISPGMYENEKKYVWPFMTATVGLFLAGAFFGYHWVLPGAIKFLVLDMGGPFHPILTIEDYTGFFMSVILGLGICFELPILIFFLALFGIVDAKFLLKHFRYAILAIFVISAIICPLQDPFSMCLFASPMLVLYFAGVGIAYFVHPTRRKARELAA